MAVDLQGIALFVFVGLSMLLAVVAIGSAGVALFALARFERIEHRQARPRTDFLITLVRGLTKNAIRNIGDVHDAYRAFFGVGVLRSSHLEEIGECLQRAALRLGAAPPPSPGAPPETIERVQELLAANQRALDVDRMCVPFSGTPEPERELLEELLQLPAEDKIRTAAKLEELAKAVRFRQDTVDHLRHKSARSVTLAQWGWYGVLALAVVSIILGLASLGF